MKKVFSVLLIIIFLILGVIAVPVISYFVWQNNLNKEIAQLHCKSNLSQDLSLDEKFKNFVLSEEDITFVELNSDEVALLLGNTNIINGGTIENICVMPHKNTWNVLAKVNIQGINLPWLRLDISKDTIESAQLYVSNIYVGNQLIPEKIVSSIKAQINKGISDALILVSENNFLGRTITNIELLDEKIVVKGSL
mgnify:FL=1